MRDIDRKRKKEQRVVEEMIRLYCRKNHSSWKIKHSAATAGSTATARKCGRRSVRSCGFPDPACCYTIL